MSAAPMFWEQYGLDPAAAARREYDYGFILTTPEGVDDGFHWASSRVLDEESAWRRFTRSASARARERRDGWTLVRVSGDEFRLRVKASADARREVAS